MGGVGVSGTIPSEFANLKNLGAFFGLIDFNVIVWKIPCSPFYRSLHFADNLSLAGNRLTGTIPKELGLLTRLSTSKR